MSYALSGALQGAIYQQLQSDGALSAMIGDAVYDALPSGDIPATYVMLGVETVLDRSDKTGAGAEHRLTVSVVSDVAGFGQAKEVAGRISDLLHDADLTLTRGRLVYLNFNRATARRVGTGNTRRIDLRFRARVEDNL
ncbi:MAG: DUF3168 domain-containing protein [Rhodobacteraceae bacterium]|nr:DUF3168 domain-containing protein [Paracoccaceae bacterium]MCW9044541.1 DUF3168 domain-containing protein [Pseudopelagicola sp.]